MGPRRLHVTRILSTPVWGVERRKEMAAGLLAPLLLSDMVTGMTPQEHSGSGTPNKDAFVTDARVGPPRCPFTHLAGMTTLRTPARRKPKSRYGAMITTFDQKLRSSDCIHDIMSVYPSA
jgi:hypothetical protein